MICKRTRHSDIVCMIYVHTRCILDRIVEKLYVAHDTQHVEKDQFVAFRTTDEPLNTLIVASLCSYEKHYVFRCLFSVCVGQQAQYVQMQSCFHSISQFICFEKGFSILIVVLPQVQPLL